MKRFVALFAGAAVLAGIGLAQDLWVNQQFVKNGAVDVGNPAARLAVRSGPGANFAQVDALPHGTQVKVLESKAGWARVKTASQSGSGDQKWVLASYIQGGAVNTGSGSAGLAIRSGPGGNFKQVGSLVNGQKVAVLESREGWLRVEEQQVSQVAVQPKPAPVQPKPAPVQPKPAPVQSVRAVEPVRPPVENLVLSGDFSASSLALPSAGGSSSQELSGRWVRSSTSAWEIAPTGGNLGPYVRPAASKDSTRLLYVVSDGKRSKGTYYLRFDYLLTNPADTLGVKVFVTDKDITVGTIGGNFRMNGTEVPADMIMLTAGQNWVTYYVPVDLADGYNGVYVLFTASGSGSAGVDNVSLSPLRK